ncbi:MAG TPA: hypothetical protein VK490_02365 [Gaiellaceae bacterium]|jgi:hypothetical protein|nr:hypothetical protein [Gaiellaceae bacterium]
MNGMLTHRFSGRSDEDFAVSQSFHHEFAPAGALCELSITSASENDDQAGTNLGFVSYTYTDPDGTPHEVPIDFGSRRSVVAHDRMIRVEWYMRIYRVDSAGLFNVFFWDHVW